MILQPMGWARWAALLALVGVLCWALSHWAALIALDRSIHDRFIRAMPSEQVASSVVLVDIDERSLQMLGPWPWPRPLIAELSQRLSQAGVAHQAWDMFFAEEQTGDSIWRQQIEAAAGTLTLGQVLVLDSEVAIPPQVGVRVGWRGLKPSERLCARDVQVYGHLGTALSLGASVQAGHLSATPDQDGRLRQIPAVICDSGQAFPQFALAIALATSPKESLSIEQGRSPWGPAAWVSVGAYRFPLDSRGWMPIPYSRSHSRWSSVSAADVLAGRAPEGLLRGKMVLLGSSAVGLGDAVATPFHPHAPGVSVHAELLDASLQQRWRFEPVGAAWITTALTMLFASAAIPFVRKPRRWWGLALFLVFFIVAPFGVAYLASSAGRIILVLPQSLALVAGAGLFLLVQIDQQRRQTRRLALHLESFLPKSLAQEVAQQSPNGQALGRPGEGVLLGVQVRGLDRWTGSVDSLRALAFIHGLLTTLDRALLPYQGSLEQRQGDLVLITLSKGTDIPGVLLKIRSDLEPLLESNETVQSPLSLQMAVELGPYLLAIAGSQGSRRPLMLGPVVDSVQAMVALGQELAAPIVVGPVLAHQWGPDALGELIELGHFVLPEQPEPKPLARWQRIRPGV